MTADLSAAVAALLDRNAQARAALRAAVEGLSDADRRASWPDGSCVHDAVAHLAAWEDGFAAALEMALRGDRPEVPGYEYGLEDATDRLNARLAPEFPTLSWEQVIARLDAADARHDAALRAVPGALPPERFEDGRSARRLAAAYRHFEEHTPQIVAWRAGTGRSNP
ncbi:MAG: DinB family protein [Dehalococcoidia bacterium]